MTWKGSPARREAPDHPDWRAAQWRVNTADNPDFDPPQSSAGYAVFGAVIEGMDVVDEIQRVATESRHGMGNVPTISVVISSVERIE